MARKRNRRPSQAAAQITLSAEPATMQEMAKRGRGSVSVQEAESVRQLIDYLLDRRFDQNMAELGRKVGVSGQAISQIKSGQNRPGWTVISGLATYLNIKKGDVLAWQPGDQVEATIHAEPTSNVEGISTTEGNVELMADLLRLRDLPRAAFPRLEFAIGFYAHEPARWSPATIQAARQGQFEELGCRAWTSPQWAEALDRLEAVIRERHLFVPKPQPPSLPPPAPPKREPSARRRSR